MNEAKVPCDGCTLCCHNDAARLLPGDLSRFPYKTVPHSSMPGQLMLGHKENGDCVYLGPSGCTIHADRPQMCREMDCRAIVRAVSKRVALTMGGTEAVYRRGRELIKGEGR